MAFNEDPHYHRYIGLWKIRRWIACKSLHLASVYTSQLFGHISSLALLNIQHFMHSFIQQNQHSVKCIVGARHCPRYWRYKRNNADVFWINCCSLNLSGRLYCRVSAIKFPFPGRSFCPFPPFLTFYCRHLFLRPRKDPWAERESSHL